MSTVTIPKKMTKGEELVVIPLKEYEALLWQKKVREFMPTSVQKRALKEARKNRAQGKYFTINELKRKLDSRG